MIKHLPNIGTARASPHCRLEWRQSWFHNRSHDLHDRAAEKPSEARRQGQGTLPICTGNINFLGYPQQEINVGTEDAQETIGASACSMMALPKEMRREIDTKVVQLVRFPITSCC